MLDLTRGRHRPEPVVCPGRPESFEAPGRQVSAALITLDPSVRCASESECTAGPGGHCTRFTPLDEVEQCLYDECYEDGDCADGQVCECGGAVAGAAWNRCVQSGCSVDADCGRERRCAPSPNEQCGPTFPIKGYFCQGAADDQCAGEDSCDMGYCTFSDSEQRWQCASGMCAGRGA
jgi:hypothetical protein